MVKGRSQEHCRGTPEKEDQNPPCTEQVPSDQPETSLKMLRMITNQQE